MKLRLLIILIILAAAAPASAQRRGLFIFGNIEQALQIEYEFRNMDSSSESSSTNHRSHLLEEEYTLVTDYAVYHPRLLSGRAALGIIFSQGLTSSTGRDESLSNGWGFNYDITGTFLDTFPYPLSFYARSETESVLRDFGGSFDVTSDSYGATFRYQNKYFPFSVSYNTVSTTTSGLGRTRVQALESISFSGTHELAKINRTSISLARSVSSSRTSGSGGLSSNYVTDRGSLTNTLSWATDQKARSFSLAGGFIRESGDVSAFSWDAGGGLLWDLGRALTLRGDINTNRINSPYRSEQLGRFTARHRLFSSITSTGGFLYRKAEVTDGKELERTYTYGVSYQKKLPLEGLLSVGYTMTTGNVVRTGEQSSRFEMIEAIASFTEPIIIDDPGVEPENIRVFNHNPQIPVENEPLVEYQPFVDFIADELTGDITIFIVPGGAIQEGQRLFISYQVVIDPNLAYSTSASAINGSLALWGSRLRLYGNLQETSQEPENKKKKTTFIFGDYRTLETGLQYTGDSGWVQAAFMRTETPEERSRSVFASVSRTFTFPESSLTVYAKDRISWHSRKESIIGQPQSRRDNAVTTGLQFNTMLDSNVLLRLRANYLNIRGRMDTDDLSLYGTLQIRIGKVFIELLPEIHWSRTGSSSQLSEKIKLQLTRFF